MNMSEIRAKFPMYKDVPDEQLVIGLHRKYYADMPFADFHKNIQYDQAPDPTQGMSGTDKFNAGMGKAFTDLGRGAAQMVNMGPSGAEVSEQRQQDAPLMKTGAGAAGNISGNVAAFAPLSVVPGANAVAGAGVLGAVTGAFQPTEDTGDRLTNMATGGALGAGVQALAGPIAQRLGEWGAGRQAEMALKKSQNAVADETLKRGREAGYVVPPSAVGSSWLEKRLESVAGKAALGQDAAIRNQPVTDTLSREAASLRPDQAIDKTNLRQARFDLAAPHREVSALNPQAAQDLSALQQARFDSKQAWKEYSRGGNRTAYTDAQAADANVKRLQASLEGQAQQAGRPDLVDSLRKANERLAQNHQVQRAMNVGTGSVDASVIGRELDNGAKMTGPLETIGRFQQAYKPYMREGSSVPTPQVGKTEALAAALMAGSGYGLSDSPYGLAAGALPLLSGPTRAALLSKTVQNAVAKPNYSAGLTANSAAALENPETRRRAAMLGRALALPAIPQVNQ